MKKLIVAALSLNLPTLLSAQSSVLDTGDTAWMLVSTALVMLMTPAGLALFYSGLTQNKSVLNTIGMSYVAYCTGVIAWIFAGYTIAFTKGDYYGIIGSFEYLFLNGILPSDMEGSIPKLLDVMFQGTFAAIAVAIVSGSIIERVRFSTWTIFSFLWVLIVYSPICHWIWGGKRFEDYGFIHGDLDFAGGTVIHISAGVAGLVLSLILGNRIKLDEERLPSSIKLMILGSGLLWFGWHGFNGGSAYGANGLAASAILVTNVAACMGGMVWLLIEWFIVKKPTLIGIASGAVSGLVGITPAAGFVDVQGALIIGVISSIVGYIGVVKIKKVFGHDDTLDAFGMHGLVGIAGAILTGFLAKEAVGGTKGAFEGNWAQVGHQLLSVGLTIVYSAVATLGVFKISSLITGGGRIQAKVELEGMDIGYHGEQQIAIDSHVIQDTEEEES
ncbi:ammonium transporter [Cyclobacteriaceae bacterium]|nr:ammonium transporter [Cyclobacteriaceae bacterium]